MFFLGSSGLSPVTFPWMPLLLSVFLIRESWILTKTEAREACSSLVFSLGYFVSAWTSCKSALGRILVGWDSSSVPRFITFVDNNSHCGSFESQNLRNGFVPYPDQLLVLHFFSYSFSLDLLAYFTLAVWFYLNGVYTEQIWQ